MSRTRNKTQAGSPNGRGAVALIGALAIACAAGSCDRADSAQRAIESAGVRMDSLSAPGSNPAASVKFRRDALLDIATKLKPVADGETSQAQAASMIVARAKAGLGEISAKDASETEQGFLSQITIARAQLDQWISQHSTAAALLSYDPAKDLADLDKQAADKFKEAGKYQADKAKQEAVVAEIRGRAEKSRAAAKLERDREAGIRKQAEGLSQTERESYITRAAEASRAADALERTAAELSAEAAKEAPKVEEIANVVDRLQKQVDSLKQTKDALKARAAAAKTNADQATAEANAVGAKIKTSLDTLAQKREAAGSPTQEAIKQYTGAVQNAKKVMGSPAKDVKSAAAAAVGGYQQCIGDIHATRARSLAVYAATLGAIAEARPAVPGSAEIAAKATAVGAELEQAKKDGEASYEEALGSYDKAIGSAAEAKSKLEQVKKALQELKDLRSRPVKEPEPEKPAAPVADAKPADAGKPAPAAAVAAMTPEEESAARAGAMDLLKRGAAAMAAGDIEKFREMADFGSDAEKQMFDATVPLALSVKKLDAACKTKFGKDLATLASESQAPAVKGNPLMTMALPQLRNAAKVTEILSPENVAKAEIKVESPTKAVTTLPGDNSPTDMAKVGDVWKFTSSEQAKQMIGMIAPRLPLMKKMGEAVADVGAQTEAGKYATADDMLTDLSAKLMGAAAAGMGGPGGPGGPGGKPKPPTGDAAPKPPKGGG